MKRYYNFYSLISKVYMHYIIPAPFPFYPPPSNKTGQWTNSLTRNAPEQGYIPFLQSKRQFATTVHLPSPGFPLAPASENAEFEFIIKLKHNTFAFCKLIRITIYSHKLRDFAHVEAKQLWFTYKALGCYAETEIRAKNKACSILTEKR